MVQLYKVRDSLSSCFILPSCFCHHHFLDTFPAGRTARAMASKALLRVMPSYRAGKALAVGCITSRRLLLQCYEGGSCCWLAESIRSRSRRFRYLRTLATGCCKYLFAHGFALRELCLQPQCSLTTGNSLSMVRLPLRGIAGEVTASMEAFLSDKPQRSVWL